jgi:tetraacyldisaccharide 4'-kinase
VRGALEAFFRGVWWAPRRGVAAGLLRPLSALYGLLWRRRQAAAAPPGALPVPVLVVGNIVVGGAGKTPTVIALVAGLRQRGWVPGIVSRGHGGRAGSATRAVGPEAEAAEVGDEPLLLARRTGAPVFVGRDRLAAARHLLQAHPTVNLIVADDGLQHQPLPRAAEVVVFDERGLGNGLLLPAGPLREPLPSPWPARRQVLYTHGQPSTPLAGHAARRALGRAWPLAAWWAGDASAAVPVAALRGRPLLAAAGLAAPEKFFGMLREAGLHVETLPLPDHHPFDTLPWPATGGDVLVTEKDAVKLACHPASGRHVWVLPLDLAVPEALLDRLAAELGPAPTPTHTPPPPP